MRTRLDELCSQVRGYADSARHAEPRAGVPWFRVANADGERAKVYIYDLIDAWGVNAQDFAAQLDAITAAAIDLHINSPGGSVWDANAIYAALKNHPATVTVHVDGLAASAASYIAMAGEEILIAKPARMMIHDALGVVRGNAADMRMVAEQLDEISQGIAEIYAERAGGKVEGWREAMQANGGFGTWYSAAEAVKSGLADKIDGVTPAPTPAPEPAPATEDSTTVRAEDARTQLVRAGARLFPKGVNK